MCVCVDVIRLSYEMTLSRLQHNRLFVCEQLAAFEAASHRRPSYDPSTPSNSRDRDESRDSASKDMVGRFAFSRAICGGLAALNRRRWRAGEPPLEMELDEFGILVDTSDSNVLMNRCSSDSLFRVMDTSGQGVCAVSDFLECLDKHRPAVRLAQVSALNSRCWMIELIRVRVFSM